MEYYNIPPLKYYLIDNIFNCENTRYLSKCSLMTDMTLIPLDSSGNFVNIISLSYNTPKLRKILALPKQSGGYYMKYLKYKSKYMDLKKLI